MSGARRHVIVDTDCGSDDAVGLLLLLCSRRSVDIDVVGVTCVHGNTEVDNVCRNVLLLLESLTCQPVPVSVYKGCREPIVSKEVNCSRFHGEDGFADLNLPDPVSTASEEHAVLALNRLAALYKGCTVLCMGPLTNIALAIKLFPEFLSNVGSLYLMGGSTTAVGNVTNSAEFNFYLDPEAADIVLSSATQPVTVLPWELCLEPALSLEWRFGVLGRIQSPHIQLLTEVEAKCYKDSLFWNPCDAFLAAAFINPSIVTKSRPMYMTVELWGTHTRGQVVLGHQTQHRHNVVIIDSIDFELFKQMLLDMAHN